MNKIYFSILLISLLSYSSRVVYAQMPDFQNIDIEALSDDQIKNFVKKAEDSGYSQEQLIVLAKTRGMSETQIQFLKKRIDQLNYSRETDNNSDISRIRAEPANPTVVENGGSENSKIFGLNYFRNSKLNLDASTNIPTPDNYVLGPGDELIIDIWGASEYTYQKTISPEGTIKLPNIGPIYVNGYSLEKAKSRIVSKLGQIYNTIGTSTSADVTLGKIRTINVHVIGAVRNPGTYTLSSFSSMFSALYASGGPSDIGSLREIELFRENKLIETFDSYDFFVRGTGKNPSLHDQDVIIIRPFKNKVTISGQVKMSGIFELKEHETLKDLLFYTGGFTEEAYISEFSIRRLENNVRTVKSVPIDSIEYFKMLSGDELNIPIVPNYFEGRVRIEGALKNPGEFEFKDGMQLLELIRRAEGIRGDAFMERGLIIREKDDLTLNSLAFDVKAILAGTQEVVLEDNDLVKIQSIFDMREEYSISIHGEVLKPGKIPFISGMTIENLIFMVGGFKESASRSVIEVARRIDPDLTDVDEKAINLVTLHISSDLSLDAATAEFVLEPFDLVVVRRNPNFGEREMIEIEGEVEKPGFYAIESRNERISDFLRRSGGLSPFAYPKGATLIRYSEYYENTEREGNDAVLLRRADLNDIFDNESTSIAASAQKLKRRETIGIDLPKILSNVGSKYDLIIKPNDVINIPSQLQTIRIRGEVLYPNIMREDRKFSFRDYISQSGGYTGNAMKKNAYVIYASGDAAMTKSFLWMRKYPVVAPGCEIIIPKKPDREPLGLQTWLAITTTMATMALVVSQIAK